MSIQRQPSVAVPGPEGVQGGLRIGCLTFHPRSGDLEGPSSHLRLEPKVAALLACLASRPGEVITKEELLAEVWAGAFVTEDALWKCLATLRRALGDAPRNPRYIETIPRRGYRLVADVETLADGRLRDTSAKGGATGVPGGTGARRPAATVPSWRHLGLTGLSLVALLVSGNERHVPVEVALPVGREVGDREAGSPRELTALATQVYRHRDLEGIQRAQRLLRRALEVDASYAPAWADLSVQLTLEGIYHGGRWELLEEARAAAETALRLDPELARGHAALGMIHHIQGEPWEAIRFYESAWAREADLRTAHNLSVLHRDLGLLDRAFHWLDRTDPTSPNFREAVTHNACRLLYLLAAHEEARSACEAGLPHDPSHPGLVEILNRLDLLAGDIGSARERSLRLLEASPSEGVGIAAFVELVAGRTAEARRLYEGAAAVNGGLQRVGSRLGMARVLWVQGDRDEAARLVRSVPGLLEAPDRGLDPWAPERSPLWGARLAAARSHAVLERAEEAIAELARATGLGFVDYQWLGLDPLLAPLHGDPAFEAMRRTLELRVRDMRARNGVPGEPHDGAMPAVSSTPSAASRLPDSDLL